MSTKQREMVTTINGDELRIDFADGSVITLDASQLDGQTRAYACMHGLKQKLVDAAAMSAGATIEEKFAAVDAVAERIRQGEWNAKRGEGGVRGGLLFEALCRLYPAKTPADIRAWLGGKTPEEQAAMRKSARVATIIAEIRAEKAASGSGDELFAELEG